MSLGNPLAGSKHDTTNGTKIPGALEVIFNNPQGLGNIFDGLQAARRLSPLSPALPLSLPLPPPSFSLSLSPGPSGAICVYYYGFASWRRFAFNIVMFLAPEAI